MDNINKDMARMVAEMREVGELPAPSKGGSHNNLLRYNEMRERILEKFLSVFDAGYTLTPPNEALTLEQLRQMDGEPVWVESIQEQQTQPEGWCVIGIFGRGRFLCALIPGDEDTPWELDTYGKCWLAYRRPPEGKED